MILLIIAFVVFGFDIVWQFYVAGMYAPKKARKLILDDPMFQELRQRLVTLEGEIRKISILDPEKIQNIEKQLAEIQIKILNVTPDGYTQELDSNIRGSIEQHITSLGEGLRSYINGAIGNLASGYYNETGMTEQPGPPLAEAADKIDKELLKMQTMSVVQEQKAQFYYNILEPMVGSERAEKLSVGLVMAPKWLSTIVKKKISAMVKEYGG